MADPRSSRPKRAAAIYAKVKVEESFEVWGQPPATHGSKRATPQSRRSTTAPKPPQPERNSYPTPSKPSGKKSSAGRKGNRKNNQHDDGFRPSSPTSKRAAEDEAQWPSAKRRKKKGQEPVQSIEDDYEPSKTRIAVLSSPGSERFKNALQHYSNNEEEPATFETFRDSSPTDIHSGEVDEGNTNPSMQLRQTDHGELQQESSPSKVVILKLPKSTASNTTSNHTFATEAVAQPHILSPNDASQENVAPLGDAFVADFLEHAEGTQAGAWQLEISRPEAEEPENTRKSGTGGNARVQLQTLSLADIATQEEEGATGADPTATPSFFPQSRRRFLKPLTREQPAALPTSENAHSITIPAVVHDDTTTYLTDTQTQSGDLKMAPHSPGRDMGFLNDGDMQIYSDEPVYDKNPASGQPLGFSLGMQANNVASAEVDDSFDVPGEAQSRKQSTATSALLSRSSFSSSQGLYHLDDTSESSVSDPDHTATVCDSDGIQGSPHGDFAPRHKSRSIQPPSMSFRTPKIYFDRNPLGSSIGTHSYDPLIGLPDHSDPRTFHTHNPEDWPHVWEALKPTMDHFRKLTGGADPGQVPLDSGYDIAHIFLQSRLRVWYVEHHPEYTRGNVIPQLFKLGRWTGAIQHWRFASNSPVRPIVPPVSFEMLTLQVGPAGDTYSQDGAPIQQNYPACTECMRDFKYCFGFQGDIRNRCTACVKNGKSCSHDLAPFRTQMQI